MHVLVVTKLREINTDKFDPKLTNHDLRLKERINRFVY
jgi:hypothetical protein